MSMSPEATELYARLAQMRAQLTLARNYLEQIRVLGDEAQQVFVATRTEVHSLKDQLAALAAEEGKK